jgi:hypothetical protein
MVGLRSGKKQTTRFLSWGGLIGSFPTRLQAERWIQQETETVAREMLAEVPSEIKINMLCRAEKSSLSLEAAYPGNFLQTSAIRDPGVIPQINKYHLL